MVGFEGKLKLNDKSFFFPSFSFPACACLFRTTSTSEPSHRSAGPSVIIGEKNASVNSSTAEYIKLAHRAAFVSKISKVTSEITNQLAPLAKTCREEPAIGEFARLQVFRRREDHVLDLLRQRLLESRKRREKVDHSRAMTSPLGTKDVHPGSCASTA
jgi:hypothetical protein